MMMKIPDDVLKEVAARMRARRKDMGLSQEVLAARSGVSFGSLKRYERTGLISLEGLLKLAVILDALKDFDALFVKDETQGLSLDDILRAAPKPKKSGRS